jgi:nitroreductase
MDWRTAIEVRASVRSYTDDPVSEQDLREMVRLAGLAPSVNNAQPWKFIAVTNAQLRTRMEQTVRRKVEAILPEPVDGAQRSAADKVYEHVSLFGKAPVVIAIATRTYRAFLDEALVRGGMTAQEAAALRGYPDTLALGASIENLQLAATGLGYASCWVTAAMAAARELEVLLGIEVPWRLGAVVMVGRRDTHSRQSPKRPLDDILEIRK